jgi:thrombospondin type 3 repeat protein/parallel beta helix pectate lyase-like protein
MAKWLVLLLLVLLYIATPTSGAVPRDRDHDALPDRWERRHHLSTSKKSAKGDPDRDGLRNKREYRLRTNPRRKDTDRDGLRDRAEVRRYHTNPRKRDTDGDGYSDGAEIRAGTNPRNRKSHPSGSLTPAPGSTAPTPSTPGPPASGFPDASNTGVPPGTPLTPSGRLVISTPGAVISGRDITATGEEPAVSVNAPNVTIRNSRVRGNTIALIQNNSTGLVVEDSELINQPVSGQPNCHNGIATGRFVARRLEITGCENGAEMFRGDVVFEDNWIHDLDVVGPSYYFGNAPPHADGIQLNGGGANVQIRHNTISPQDSGTARSTSGIIANEASDNVRIEDNRIDGSHAGYAVYAPREARSAWFISRNQMSRGVYGYTACVRPGITVTVFSGNRDVGTGSLISPDNGVGGGCTN